SSRTAVTLLYVIVFWVEIFLRRNIIPETPFLIDEMEWGIEPDKRQQGAFFCFVISVFRVSVEIVNDIFRHPFVALPRILNALVQIVHAPELEPFAVVKGDETGIDIFSRHVRSIAFRSKQQDVVKA